MNLSLNEIEGGVRKAALGAGLSVGLADDTGRAVAVLQAYGFDGISAALAGFANTGLAARPVIKNSDATFDAGNPIPNAVSALDLVAAGVVKRVLMRAIEAPLLVVGLAAIAAQDQGGGFVVGVGSSGFALVSGGGIAIEGVLASGVTEVTISRSRPDGTVRPRPDHIPDVPPAIWAQVQALAALTYVPATEASRLSGAGAGMTDND